MMSTILTERISVPRPAHFAQWRLSADEALASERIIAMIGEEIERSGGFMSFARFMELALYAPGMGYYAAGATKVGPQGDYVTAPELSPLFGQALAAQVIELAARGHDRILELGAGTGSLAREILVTLAREGIAIERYSILEVSADLRARQRRTLERLPAADYERVEWLDALPERFSGTIIGNEVLDALPVHLLSAANGAAVELGIAFDRATNAFMWQSRAPTGELAAIAAALNLPDGYTTEVHLAACGLVRTLSDRLEDGAVFFIDYGFPHREYYHPDRRQGTLMCHYRHRAHDDPLILVGVQDITAHVDFTALAEAAAAGGLDLLGYTCQAQFLINLGILDLLQRLDPEDASTYAPAAAKVQQLLSPAEMGELFKVIAFGRGIAQPLRGFRAGDRSRALAR